MCSNPVISNPKNPNDSLLCTKKSPNRCLRSSATDFQKNSTNEKVFNESKGEYENALKQSGYN